VKIRVTHHVRTLERRRQYRIVDLGAIHEEEEWPDMTYGHVFSSGYVSNGKEVTGTFFFASVTVAM
jgi:hypothetical protein